VAVVTVLHVGVRMRWLELVMVRGGQSGKRGG